MHSRSNSPDKDRNAQVGHLPVFSDYSHIAAGNVGNLKFAVGLREENTDEIISKMLPLSRFVPKIVEKRSSPPKVVVVTEEKVCMRPECIARREKLEEFSSENEHLRVELRKFEAKVAAARNKMALTEKSIAMAEEENEGMKGQIEDVQNRIMNMEIEVGKTDAKNQEMRNQLNRLRQEIETLKRENAEVTDTTEKLLECERGNRVVFGRGSSSSPHVRALIREVSQLSLHGGEDEYDSD
jgi:archaellum component FlaC